VVYISVYDLKTFVEGMPNDKVYLLQELFTITFEEMEDIVDERTGDVSTIRCTKKKIYLTTSDEVLWVYSGLLHYLNKYLIEMGYTQDQLTYRDFRVKTKSKELTYPIFDWITDTLRLRPDYQTPVVETILQKRRGIIFVPTRGGKTEMLICAVQNYLDNENSRGKVTIIVRKSPLADNMFDRFRLRGFESVGKLYGGRADYYCDILVCVVNSVFNVLKKEESGRLRRKDLVLFNRITSTDFLIVDEIQDGSADMFQYSLFRMMDINYPDIAVACSGTPYMNESNPSEHVRDMNIQQVFGQVIKRISDEYLIEQGYKSRGNVIWLAYKMEYPKFTMSNYTAIYKTFIVANFARNFRAVECISLIVSFNKRCLVLVNRINHGKIILDMLKNIPYNKRCVFSSAEETWELKYGKSSRTSISDVVSEFNSGGIDVLIGTNIYNVGVDFPGCKWMVLLSGEGFENDILNKQRTSRVLSPDKKDNNGYIVDFVDQLNPVTMKHSRSRKDIYENSRYNQFSDPSVLTDFLNRD